MTIKDVQRAVMVIRNVQASCRSSSPQLVERLFENVLTAIANSDCQDSPAELAAEALKVLEPPRATSAHDQQSDARG